MRKSKIIKFVVISILLLIILMQNLTSFAAPVTVTKENFKEALENYLKIIEKKELTEIDVSDVKVGDETITFKIGGVDYETKYDLSGEKPIFVTEIEIKEGITFKEYEMLSRAAVSIRWCYAAISNIQDIEYAHAMSYFITTYIESAHKNTSSEYNYYLSGNANSSDEKIVFGDGTYMFVSEFDEKTMEFIDKTNPKNIVITDSTYANTYIVNIKNEKKSEDSRNIIFEMEINVDANFEEIKERYEDFKENVENSQNNNQNEIILNGNNNNNKVHNTVIMANKLLKENEKNAGKTISSVNKYPNAGLESNIFVPIIKILIGILLISLIFMIIKVRKYKKD